jgi:hypothetical protein
VLPTLHTAVRVELMARQVPSSARNEQVKLFFYVTDDTLLYGCYPSIAMVLDVHVVSFG